MNSSNRDNPRTHFPPDASFAFDHAEFHPSITCAIPATSKIGHMKENMAARLGNMPDEATRKRMIEHIAKL